MFPQRTANASQLVRSWDECDIPEIKEHDGAILPASDVGEHQITMAPSDIALSGVVRQLAKSLSQFLPQVLEFRIVFLIGKPSRKGQQF